MGVCTCMDVPIEQSQTLHRPSGCKLLLRVTNGWNGMEWNADMVVDKLE